MRCQTAAMCYNRHIEKGAVTMAVYILLGISITLSVISIILSLRRR